MIRRPGVVPVLEIGGSHVTAAAVDLDAAQVVEATRRRRPLRPDTDAASFLAAVAETAAGLAAAFPGAVWGVAVPGPFDYATGVARYHGVGKFEALDGLALGDELAGLVRPAGLRFLNDATAFALGAWHMDGSRPGRLAAVTLGTGVGSAFLDEGAEVTCGPLVPPGGRMDLLTVDGAPLEERVSTRAIAERYRARTGHAVDGVRPVAERAAQGDAVAAGILDAAFRALGTALAPWLVAFRPGTLVVGGSMTAAWSLLGPPLLAALAEHTPALGALHVRVHRDGQTPALLGAAVHAVRTSSG
jgi:glucokinase